MIYARFHSSGDGTWEPESKSQSHSRPSHLSGSTVTYPLTSASMQTTRGWYLRRTENHPRDLERFRYIPRDIRQQIRRPWTPHVSRSLQVHGISLLRPPFQSQHFAPEATLFSVAHGLSGAQFTKLRPSQLTQCVPWTPNVGAGVPDRLTVATLRLAAGPQAYRSLRSRPSLLRSPGLPGRRPRRSCREW